MYTEDGDALLGPRNLQLHAVIPGQYRGGTIGGSCHKYHFCGDKTFCRDKYVCLSRQNTSFITTKVCLSRQNFCRDKIMFVARKKQNKKQQHLWQLPSMIVVRHSEWVLLYKPVLLASPLTVLVKSKGDD